MAAAKKAGTKKASAKTAKGSEAAHAALLEQAEEIPTRYDPVLLALSKADAARLLFVQCRDGSIFTEEAVEWIEGFAEDAFCEALEDAKMAYVKAVAAGTAANPKAPNDAEPPAEGAR